MTPPKLRKTIITGLVVIVSASLIYAVVKNNETSPLPPASSTATTNTPPTQTPPPQAPSPQPTAGRYVAYNEDVFTQTSGKRVLFFHAQWCPQCRAIEKSIQQGALATGLTVFKVDYDANHALRQKYGVTMQTTLVQVDQNGALIKKYVAYDQPNLASVNREFGN